MTFLYSVLSSLGLAFKLPLIARSTKMGNMRGRGYWRESDGESLTSEEAYDIWASYAYDILIGVSRSYHAVIEYGALAEEAQAASGVRTSVPFRHWIGKVLRRLVDRCHDEGVPPLTALVVKSTDGKVGDGYWAVLEVAGEPPVEDELQREYHAAAARLDCYRHFGAPLPLGGGVPALAPRLRVAVERRQGRVTVPPPTCPNCFVQLPATGICDSCGL
jgi:hypothetical protein